VMAGQTFSTIDFRDRCDGAGEQANGWGMHQGHGHHANPTHHTGVSGLRQAQWA
jgi:hypothetical protein